MMVSAQHDGCFEPALAYGFVEAQGYLGAPFAVGIEYSGLRSDDEMIFPCLPYPVDIVV